MDRAHRIGQGRPVNVYRLVTQGTVEEQVLALQRRKLEMADAVVQRPGNAGRFEERGMAGCVWVGGWGRRGCGSMVDAIESIRLIYIDYCWDSVLDLVAASVGKALQPPPQQQQVGAFGGGLLAAADNGGGVGGEAPLPSEEPWDEGQYSGFAVEVFITNVLGVGAPGK